MNYKKGIIRIFILGLVISPIAGFFSAAEQSNNIASSAYNTASRIQEQLREEPCASIVKSNPKTFPKLNPSYTCSPTYIYWDGIREWQAANGRAGMVIDNDTVDKALWADVRSQQWNVGMFQTAIYTIGYLFLCLTGLIIFYLGRWIFRGFKSQ